MSIKEKIEAEINNIKEEYLDELYRLIRNFSQTKQQPKKANIMSKLKQIKIEAPEDFAANFDVYQYGQKSNEEDIC
jgi:hypothetical protein